jgi:outer membrane lipoprotein-sorting protein
MVRLGALVAGLTLGMAAMASTAVAQVPLPTPAPLPKEGATPRRPVQAAAPRAVVAQAAPARPAPGRSILNLERGAGEGPNFTPTQRAQVDKVSAYLSSVQQLSGTFVQVGPDGSRLKGEFYIQKPGKVRFEYEAPSPIEIIADGSAVAVRDRKLATQDIYPLSQTPLRYLLSDRIDLLRDTNVVSVRADDVFVTVVIEEKHVVVGTSRLMMMVSAKDYQLKQWTVTDPQGYDTTVAVSNLDSKSRPDPGMFKIDFTRMMQ